MIGQGNAIGPGEPASFVRTGAAAAHRVLRILGARQWRPIHAGRSGCPDPGESAPFPRFAPPDGHEQGVQSDIRDLQALHRPAGPAPGPEGDARAMIAPRVRAPMARRKAGKALPPGRVRGMSRARPCLAHRRRTAGRGLSGSPEPVAFSGPISTPAGACRHSSRAGACRRSGPRSPQTVPAGHSGWGKALALVSQATRTLAIAADLSAPGPGLVQQRRLAPVSPGARRHRSLSPGTEPARPEAQAPTYRRDGKLPPPDPERRRHCG